jgi:hypothetical protein
MNLSTISAPGVYINEQNAFSNSVVPVATAVPAFIGYTPQAVYDGRSYTNVAFKIISFADFRSVYCYPSPPATKQYNPQYYLVPQKSQPTAGNYMLINGTYYAYVPDPDSIYYLYNSVMMFYQNGGADAYIVSVGSYGATSGKAASPGDQIVNANVQLNDLLGGLNFLHNEEEPTMYICPDATLLSLADNGTLMQEMLLQSSTLGTTISIFDIIGGKAPDPVLYTNDIATFRSNTGSVGLSYGTAYYPFVGTSIMQPEDIDYTNLFAGDIKRLAPIINPASAPDAATTSILTAIESGTSHMSVTQLNNALISASPVYRNIIDQILLDLNVLPPSGAMAGVMTTIDQATGVWEAPANTSIAGVSSLPIKLSEAQQGNLNVDALSGKSINAIRSFNGMGILVWGARTLDGNSNDWRYLSVRRTMVMLEQSCKLAARVYVFQPNVKNTWEAVKSMIGSFLNSIWKQGGLMGASAPDAYSVDCGLGSTMTPDDILAGFMNVTVKVSLMHPAEFIVMTFQQDMAVSS